MPTLELLFRHVAVWAMDHVPNALRIVFTPIMALGALRIGRRLIRRLEGLADDGDPATSGEREGRAQTLAKVARQALTVFVWGIAGMIVLGELGVSIGPILTGAGVAGLAVGFGAQALVKDVISGFFILLENQFRLNDFVSTAGVSGFVESMSLRTTILRDNEGRVHVIPNGSVGVVTNFTRDFSRAVVDVGVPYTEDLDRCLAVLKEVGDAMERDPVFGPKLAGAFEYPGLERFDESSLALRVSVPTRPHDRWSVLRELRRRIKKAFDEHGIDIPYPQRTISLTRSAEERLRP